MVKKRVSKYTLDGKFIRSYSSITEAALDNNIKQSVSTISKCCLRKAGSAGGFKWSYEGEDLIIKEKTKTKSETNTKTTLRKKVSQYTLDGKFIRSYSSITEAALDNNMKQSATTISKCCLWKAAFAGGFKWTYEGEDLIIKEKTTLETICNKIYKKETWKSLSFMGYTLYEVSNTGLIRNINTNYIIKGNNNNGYISVKLTHNNKYKKIFVFIV